MDLTEILNRPVSVTIWNTEKENDAHIYLGTIKHINDVYCFVNQEMNWQITLDNEQLTRIKSVPDNLKEILLNAEYNFSLYMESIPKSGDGYQKTGMIWTN